MHVQLWQLIDHDFAKCLMQDNFVCTHWNNYLLKEFMRFLDYWFKKFSEQIINLTKDVRSQSKSL